MFQFLIKDKLIANKPENSFVNQLLSVTHSIYKSLDVEYEVRGVFFDISKVFDYVWDESIIFKFEQKGFSGNLLELLADFLKDRKQSVATCPTGQILP